jgi:hypothetical protein
MPTSSSTTSLDADLGFTPGDSTNPRHNLRSLPPPAFDGSRADYAKWRRAANIYLATTTAPVAEHVAVMALLSYFNAGTAQMWADAYIDKLTEERENGDNDWSHVTVKQFWKDADAAFIDPEEARNAQHELERFQQARGLTAESYFFKFEQLAKRAGYLYGHDEYLISVLERNLLSGLVD